MSVLPVGLASSTGIDEDWAYVGVAQPDETPYDFSTRLLEMGYGNVPLWRLPQFPQAWKQFLERNRCKGEEHLCTGN